MVRKVKKSKNIAAIGTMSWPLSIFAQRDESGTRKTRGFNAIMWWHPYISWFVLESGSPLVLYLWNTWNQLVWNVKQHSLIKTIALLPRLLCSIRQHQTRRDVQQKPQHPQYSHPVHFSNSTKQWLVSYLSFSSHEFSTSRTLHR